MTEETTPSPQRSEPDRGKSGYRSASASTAADNRSNGGSGIQRSHLRDRKAWLKGRTRAGQTWAQRKAASVTYCPAKQRVG
ncbi:MAG: hypothetical protein ABSD62_03345 [Candidatus Limnocylindrales bacterium]|jgi:hypothetical protein